MKNQMKTTVAILMLSVSAFAGGGSVGSNACCIQSALDNKNGIRHSGASQYCVSNNSQEMPEIAPNVFQIEKYGYTFRIDLNQARENSIRITKPNGQIQTRPERPGVLADLFIGTFGAPIYQYSSETAMAFTLDCGKR